MEIHIELFRAGWSSKQMGKKVCHVMGWAEYRSKLYMASELRDLIWSAPVTTPRDYGVLARKMNGNFLFIIQEGDVITIVSDRLRSYTALYLQYRDTVYVTDDIREFQQKYELPLSVNEYAIEQYLLSNFVFGPNTVYQQVFSIQAAEVVTFRNEGFTHRRYFLWEPDVLNNAKKHLEREALTFHKICIRVFNSMINSVQGVDRWVVPLSGGHDSRLIVNYLYKLGVKNVICYSYGIKGNLQSKISEQVAHALGYEWFFVEYDEQPIKALQHTGLIEEYLSYAFNGSSVPHLQDFYATYFLSQTGILRKGDCFVPGHSFDFICGGHLRAFMLECKTHRDMVKSIRRHYANWGFISRSKNVISGISNLVGEYTIKPEAFADFFNWQERQTKFIVNSVRCYEFFGYKWRIPLWDNAFFEYWKDIGYTYRYNRKLFIDIEKNYLLSTELRSIPFADDVLESKGTRSIRDRIPKRIKTWLYRLGYKPKEQYHLNEGSHLMFAKEKGDLNQYMMNNTLPKQLSRYLFPKHRAMKNCEINALVTLKMIATVFNTSDKNADSTVVSK